jgi:F-type H+-transporting ATPase subunit epsilon
MANPNTFQCSVVTPERVALECAATFVAFPAHDGEMGVLRNRAPLVCKLGIGTLRVEAADGGRQVFFIDGGFAQVLDNHLTLLTERAIRVADLDAEQANKALAEARAMTGYDDQSVERRDKAIRRAQVQLALLAKR